MVLRSLRDTLWQPAKIKGEVTGGLASSVQLLWRLS